VNNQAAASSSHGSTWATIGVLGCASVVGVAAFVYKAKRTAADFDDDDDVDVRGGNQLSTPTENICVL
jgi:hypothetical protein